MSEFILKILDLIQEEAHDELKINQQDFSEVCDVI